MTSKQALLAVIPALLISSNALAASVADLGVSVTPPSGTHVYENGTFTVTVENTGNRNASNVDLDIQLPETNTSPQVYIMGTLSGYSPSCTLSGSLLSCALGTINRNTSKSVTFTIALPYSSGPLVIDADASTTTAETNLANNHLSLTASPLTYDNAVSAPVNAVNRHCTGTGLTSFFECEKFPSSISSFTSTLEIDGTVTLPDPDFYGLWTQTAADTLEIEYFDISGPAGTLVAKGVDGGCFEGPMTFPGSSYVAIYEVCFE